MKIIQLCGLMVAFMMIVFNAAAQPSRVAAGFRATPDGFGATGKFFIDRNFAVDAQLNAGGIVGLDGQSVTAVGLFEYHIPLPNPSWRIFFGGGAHVGSWTGRNGLGHKDEAILGLDGIGGVEYVFSHIPLGLSGDFKPALNFVQEVEFFPHNMVGVAARYYFGNGHVRPAAPPPPARRLR
jgi:hypothetical protein